MRIKIKFILLLAIALSFLNQSWSQDVVKPNQTKEIIYDYSNKKLTGNIPFDLHFNLVVKNVLSKDIITGQIYEVDYDNGSRYIKYTIVGDTLPKTIKDSLNSKLTINEKLIKFKKDCRCRILDKKRVTDPVSGRSIIKLSYESRTPVKKELLFKSSFSFKNSIEATVDPLSPGKLYEIILIKKNSDKNLKVFNEFLMLYKSNPDNDVVLKAYYINKIIKLQGSITKRKNEVASFPKDYFEFKENNKVMLDSVVASSTPVINVFTINHSLLTNDIIRNIGGKLISVKLNSRLYSKVIDEFLSIDTTAIKTFSNGLNASTKLFDFKKQILNINQNLKDINDLDNELAVLRTSQNDSDLDVFRAQFLIKAKKVLKKNVSELKKYNTKLTDMINTNLQEMVVISAGTEHDDLKTANANSIIPDIGLINAFGYGNNDGFIYIPRLYVGLNFHFSGINRNQKLDQIIYRKFRHRFSIALGVSVGKIDNEDFEDLYNSISPTLGFNYRIDRQIRLGIGSLFVRRKNPNPILDSTNITLAPYMSISFDLGIFKEASDFTKKIGF